ncbi:TonB-dependent receptor plug domain-containing protein [Brevundimonas sp.]|uniref:TonB-dependent receptor plug domain-containing protein n=1 Tax=Brevundimonas sp. TaxID=1871086 RepID=UPI0028A0A4F3|nr:TonB-dependent receptor plug domain-containing protein [Brevundimonas sp.]
MRILLLTSVGAAAVLTMASAAAAQTRSASSSPTAADGVPTVVVEGQGQAPRNYRMGDAQDSGTSTFNRDSIEARAPGSGDVNEILKALPTVQFTSTQGRATRAELQDLRPENISISGGSVNENLFVLDGVGVNSRLDVSGSNFAAFDDVANGSAQTVWMDASLIGEVTVRDSNISAEYGQFTGGVVEIATRAPGREYGGEAYYGLTSTEMASFRVSDRVRDSLSVMPTEPDYDKRRYGVSVDLPVSERLRMLAAYNRSESRVTNYPSTNYVSLGNLSQRSVSDNFLLKGEYDLASDLLLTGQINYSPYESEFHPINSRDNLLESHGGGLTAKLGLEGRRGLANWTLDLTHAWSDNDRDGPAGTIQIPTSAIGFGDCSLGSSCVLGSVGPLTQQQTDTGLKGKWEQQLGVGQLRAGFEYAHIEGEKQRPETVYSYLGGVASENTACAIDEGLSCIPGVYAAARRNGYAAFDASASIDSVGLWGEYNFDWSGFMIRAGARYDYESFLGNHNVAPRLSVSRDLPWAGINMTVGANRYYGRSFLGYALREGAGVTRGYTRTPTVGNGRTLWSDNWVLTSHSDTARWSNIGLDTPYSDEFMIAVNGPVAWLGGEYRIKGIIRESRDQFASSVAETSFYDTETGTTGRRSTRTITNDGERSYEGLSLEYVRDFGRNHTLSFSTNLSHTDATNISYFDLADETEFEGAQVYYQGKVVPKLEALADNQLEDYANPFIINADWAARWFDGRLRTNVNARWRDSFERVDDTGVNITIDGVRYDVFDKIAFDSSVDVNLSATFELVKTIYGAASLDLRVNNLFNTVLDQGYTTSSQPYQLGRNAWVSLKYRY